MVDIVVNHYANWGETINWSQFVPFNDAKYFHNKCWIDWSRQTSVENCWMGDGYVPLPDLNTEDSYVQSTLNTYIKDFVAKYSVDGLRIDATKNIRKDFWPPFCKAAGVYCQGEVWTGEPTCVCFYFYILCCRLFCSIGTSAHGKITWMGSIIIRSRRLQPAHFRRRRVA